MKRKNSFLEGVINYLIALFLILMVMPVTMFVFILAPKQSAYGLRAFGEEFEKRCKEE